MTIGSSMSFDPAHARLRKKAASKLKQSNAEQLEQETKRMEDRIRALKEQMVKEKEEREKYGGSRWMSSNKGGPITSNLQQSTKKKPTKSDKGPRKIKLLTDEPLTAYSKKNVIRESLNESFGSDMQCGQCERTKATLACVECTENYCVGCFMSFHKKGALKSHQTRNLDQVDNGLLEEKGRFNDSATKRTKAPDARRVQNGTWSEQKFGGALLRGSYDEKESSASFALALKEWRCTKNKDNTWVNPADDVKVSSVSCETSTAPDEIKPVEINLNFGTNKSMSYLDRLVLKKHREALQPSNQRTTSRGGNKKPSQKEHRPCGEKSNDDFGINYREIFQSIGVHSARERSSSSQNYYGRTSVAIEEVMDNNITNTEETTSCIVEEQTGDTQNMVSNAKAAYGSGRMSILGMTAYGDFREDADDIAPVSVYSRVSGSSLQSSFGRSPLSLRTKLIAQRGVSPAAESRVWSPKPTYTGLSDFFLAGVKSPLPSNSPKRELLDTSAKRVSPKLLARGVWKPHESVCVTDVTTKECDESSISSMPVIPLVREPSYDTEIDAAKGASNSIEKGNSIELDVENMQDFGIVDFLKAGPVPRKLSGDYYDVHRVSTVSPLTLTPNPPQLHWSDDDSDDDAIVDVASHVPEVEIKDVKDKLEQDDDDRVTLEDLTWELASTTGRLTHCEGNLDDCLDEVQEQQEARPDSCDEDSIEEDNGGTSLGDGSSDDIDEDEILLENSLLKEEVHALQ